MRPSIQMRRSNTMQMEYYANTCECCKANFGDFYHFSEPDHAFFPMDVEQARRMSVIELSFTGLFEFECTFGARRSGFIFEHGMWE